MANDLSINTTKTEQQIYAAQDTAAKMRLELPFVVILRKFYRKLAKEFNIVYKQTGQSISAFSYQDELKGFLEEHYKKVIGRFSKRLRRSSIKSFKQIEDDSSIDRELAQFIASYAGVRAALISQSNEDAINKAVSNAPLLFNEVIPSRDEIADVAAENIVADGYSRADTIALTETQTVSEKTKAVEFAAIVAAARLLSPDVDGGRLEQNYEKVWIAVLDQKTRIGHVFADGQIVDADEPFLVDGEYLMFPGDPNGSPGNIINCRCVSVPRIKG